MRDFVTLNRGIGALQPIDQAGIVNDLTHKANAFIESDQMGAREDMHFQAGRFHHRAHERAGGPFAIGSRDMDDRRKFVLKTTEQIERVQHPPERQFYRLWI